MASWEPGPKGRGCLAEIGAPKGTQPLLRFESTERGRGTEERRRGEGKESGKEGKEKKEAKEAERIHSLLAPQRGLYHIRSLF